jgi:DUF1680 family protein
MKSLKPQSAQSSDRKDDEMRKLTIVGMVALAAGMIQPFAGAAESRKDYPVQPVPFTAVHVESVFWTPRLETNRQTTVWYDFKRCEETGRIDNFAKAGGLMAGSFRGSPFDDSDVYKVMEGAAYSLALQPDPKLDDYLDGLIAKIAAAQEPDGYLYTARKLGCKDRRIGKDRWLNERGAQSPGFDSHELYNLGHLYEAAAAHFEATGKTNLLGVAIRSADLVANTWGKGKLEIPSGHQEIEIGLVKLFRVTHDEKYLELAKFLLDCRGNGRYTIPPGHFGTLYYSDHKPVTQQTEAVGHSVRSAYMYSAMADVAAIIGDDAYAKAIDSLWNSVVGHKLYLTGGIGADKGTEGFGPDYVLPNEAYNETCAAIANALWNHRMFLLHGDSKYLDVLERILYNGFLSGVGLTGNKFFYPNPLASHGNYGRSPWFGCACCPVNIVRFLPEIPGYIYAIHGGNAYVNLFIAGTAKLKVDDKSVEIRQATRYPWDGHVKMTINPEKAATFSLNIRIPGWARNEPVPGDLYRYADTNTEAVELKVNGEAVPVNPVKGFACLNRQWKRGDTVELTLPMPIRRIVANPLVKDALGKVAIQRGPVVYCAEGVDNGGKVLDKILDGNATLSAEFRAHLLNGVMVVKAASAGSSLTLAPYYSWNHRGVGEMAVWLKTR